MKKTTLVLVSYCILMRLAQATPATAQNASADDSLRQTPNVIGGIYDRPYISGLADDIAIGGYVEMNSNFRRDDGIEEGFSFEARRFNIFIYSSISEHVKMTSELEFEHGAEEIALETALVDVLLNTAINLRAGVLLSPIGRFNIAHDSPRYDIIDRPLVSTEIIPATLSEVGIGFFGALYPTRFDRLTYEIYAVNGLGDGVVAGSGEGTRISAGKSPTAFEQDNNGSPAFTGRLALNPRFGGELGLSFHTGNFNSYKIDGSIVDEQRRLTMFALDFETKWHQINLRGEAALARIDVPESLTELFAEKQRGLYAEIAYPILNRAIAGFSEASLTAVLRYDYVDLNQGTFSSTKQNIGDSLRRLTLGLSFRPTAETSLRLSYSRNWHRDAFENRHNAMNIQLGLATYF